MTAPSTLRIGRRYRPSRLDGPYDAIVIGSGMGGMTTAACLSRLGKKVLVLEQHYTAGGFTHAYARNGYEWDVGVHYIGDVGSRRSLSRQLFDFVSDAQLEWAPMDNNYDRFFIGDEQFEIGPGDFMAFPKHSPAHHLHNSGSDDLVYLCGGTRAEIDVCNYPNKGLRQYRIDGRREFIREDDLTRLDKR